MSTPEPDHRLEEFAEGAVLMETGQTRVICAASVEDRVPGFLAGTGKGWITAEYAMLPRSTTTRTPRQSREGGRVREIQRLIGLVQRDAIPALPSIAAVAAVSVGIVDGEALLDLCYEEDARADVDFNVVMTDQGEFVEVQGTAEGRTFSKGALDDILQLAETGIGELLKTQQDAIEPS